jgi:hypothetical protein
MICVKIVISQTHKIGCIKFVDMSTFGSIIILSIV